MKIPQDLLKQIKRHQAFLAHIHLSPDADSIGSALGLKIGLESIGKVVHLFSEDKLPSSADFLPQIDSIAHQSLPDMLSSQIFNAYISLDTPKWRLITHHSPPPDIRKPVLNIDHHPVNEIKTSLQWLDPEASSTAQMVFHLLKKLEVDITPSIATCLLFGLLGDTGAFHNFNTSPASLRLAALLIQAGGDYNRCLVELTHDLEFDQLKAWALLLENLQLSADKTFAYTTLSHHQTQNIEKLGMSRFANSIISNIKDIKFGAVLAEKESGITYGSIRSRLPQVDVSLIARKLNGGGHKNAAGFRLEEPIDRALSSFLQAAKSIK